MIHSIEEGRKEDGNRSIADKIIKRLHDIDKTVENNQGRWAWELLQNAKDSISEFEQRKIKIQLILSDDLVEFRHTGLHFTERDIRGLINQISSKEVSDDQEPKKTGRFGTGFLTTHLLSRVIEVKGIVHTIDDRFYKFEFPLNREGKTTFDLIPKIESAWSAFHSSAKEITKDYNSAEFNTSFTYHLRTLEQKNIARIGCDEFSKLIPYVLAFIPKIESVDIIDSITGDKTSFLNSRVFVENSILKIVKTKQNRSSEVLILIKQDSSVNIAIEVEQLQNGYAIKNLSELPKLFCDFPLIGTEKFHFPVIVNSFHFNPQTERDGIWLKDKKDGSDREVLENQDILEKAIELFEDLLNEISSSSFFDLYNLAETRVPDVDGRYFDETWFTSKIQKNVRKILIAAPVVELENSSSKKKAIADIWFPSKSYSVEVREKLWKAIYDFFPEQVCKKTHMHQWVDKAWDEWRKLTYSNVAATIAETKNLTSLSSVLGQTDPLAMEWLNGVCSFFYEDENNWNLFEKNALTPDQYGSFKKRSQLSIDKVQDVTLIEVLRLLGTDWHEILLHKYVRFGEYSVKEKKDIGLSITEKLKGNFARSQDSVKAISLLSEWFENNREEGKNLFSELYKKRAELFMNTISDKESLYRVMRSKTDLAQLSQVAAALDQNPKLLDSLRQSEQINGLLLEFGIDSIDELRRILGTQQRQGTIKIEFDQDVLIGLGVTTLEELEERLKDRDIAALFSHTSTPNAAMFLYVQKLISRAKKNILAYLGTLPQYDLQEMEEVAKTVIGGIKKDGLEIHIVVRPSDTGQVIVYYSSEKDTLDYANAELWIENGVDSPQLLTLGRILKNTGINKIPV